MTYRIEIRPLATIEIIEAYNWYESQKAGLGLKFLDSVDAFYHQLLINPHTHSYYEKPVRQGILDRFPYTIVYETFDDVIVIYSVFMQNQNPEKKRSQ